MRSLWQLKAQRPGLPLRCEEVLRQADSDKELRRKIGRCAYDAKCWEKAQEAQLEVGNINFAPSNRGRVTAAQQAVNEGDASIHSTTSNDIPTTERHVLHVVEHHRPP